MGHATNLTICSCTFPRLLYPPSVFLPLPSPSFPSFPLPSPSLPLPSLPFPSPLLPFPPLLPHTSPLPPLLTHTSPLPLYSGPFFHLPSNYFNLPLSYKL